MMHPGARDATGGSAPRENLRAAQDLARIERMERRLKQYCRPLAEICIVPLPTRPAAPAHLHALLVPDFSRLREHRQPNSRELLRFEFQKAARSLEPGERPHSFSVRARPLPRLTDREPDRERLRKELWVDGIAQMAEPDSGVPPPSADPIAACVEGAIREFRPLARPRADANLELDLEFDSLDRVQLISTVEQMLGISIPAAEAARIFTVRDLKDAIASRVAGSEATGGIEIPPAAVSWPDLLDRRLDARERALARILFKPRPLLSFLAWGAARLLRVLFGRRFQFRVYGRHLLPSRGPYLLVANHCSHLDPLFLLWALPFRVARRLSFMGHTEYFGSGWKAAVAERLKLAPVDPDEHAREGMRLCAEALRRGFIGAVFPEGERSPDGAQQRFHRGAALLAMHFQAPIVPVGIAGTYDVLPRGRDRIRSRPVQVCIGEALRPMRGESEQDLLARAWAAVWRLRSGDAYSREPIPRPFAIGSAPLL